MVSFGNLHWGFVLINAVHRWRYENGHMTFPGSTFWCETCYGKCEPLHMPQNWHLDETNWWKDSVQFTDHIFFFHVDKIIDQPHLSKRIPSVSFKFISCQKICRYYVEMSNCNLCITRCFKFQVEGYRSVPLKFESELLYLVKKKSNPFWRY